MMAEESQAELLLKQAIAAVKAGKVEEARELLLRVLDLDRDSEKAWLWMSAVVDGEDKTACLKNALALNPHNEYARLGLEALLDAKWSASQSEAGSPAEVVNIDQDRSVLSRLEPLLEETSSSPRAGLPASAEEVPREAGLTRAMYFGLGALALVTVAVCGAALLLGGMLLTTGPLQGEPTTLVSQIPAATAMATPGSRSTAISIPSPTKTPLPTNTLVVPNARIPGFPIVNEGAYPEIEARVSDLRQLKPLRGVQRQTFTRYRLEDYLYDVYQREEYSHDIEVSESIYQVLGLMEEDHDLKQVLIEAQRNSIAGLYDSEQEAVYLVLDRYTGDLWLEITFAHEFAHALQDQHFDLDLLQGQAMTTDSTLALQALIEGDATLVMAEYALEYLFEVEFDRGDLLEAIQEVEQGEYQDAPGVVRETAWFPYDQGIIFAATLVEQGGWDQVNQAFRNPPQTTEQIMHPDKYLAGEGVRIPEIGDLLSVLGPGWLELRRDVVGELLIRIYLERELGSEEALMASEGWEGDRLIFLENEPQDRYALVLQTAWDSTANAEEFFSFYVTFMQRGGIGFRTIDEPHRMEWRWEDQVTHLSQQGQNVLLVLTSDGETMDLVLKEFPAFWRREASAMMDG